MKLAAQGYDCYHAGHGSRSQRRTELLRGVLDLCLLAVMNEGPAYGYEMTKRLRDRGLATVGEGSIYPLLGRLERDGLVETYRAASNGGPMRKYYRPSPRVDWRSRWACPNGEPPATPSTACSPQSKSRCFMTDFVERCRPSGGASLSPMRSPTRWRPTWPPTSQKPRPKGSPPRNSWKSALTHVRSRPPWLPSEASFPRRPAQKAPPQAAGSCGVHRPRGARPDLHGADAVDRAAQGGDRRRPARRDSPA